MSLRRIGSDTLTLFSACRNSIKSLPLARRAFPLKNSNQIANAATTTTTNPTRNGIASNSQPCVSHANGA